MNTNATEYTENTSSGSSGSEEALADISNQDWDKILRDYEEYTDKYIELMKKVKKNDMSAMSEYQEMYDKAEQFGNDLDRGQGNLSSAQLSKMMKIQTKLANAAMEMSN